MSDQHQEADRSDNGGWDRQVGRGIVQPQPVTKEHHDNDDQVHSGPPHAWDATGRAVHHARPSTKFMALNPTGPLSTI